MLNLYTITYFVGAKRTTQRLGATCSDAIERFLADTDVNLDASEIIAVERVPYDLRRIDAMVDDALNLAIKSIQDAMGIKSGDHAAQWWQGETKREAKCLLQAYARHELRMNSSDGHVFASADAEH